MTKPNLYVIGGMRCGSTAMCSYLAEHPEVFFSKLKEPKFFLLKRIGLDFQMASSNRDGFLGRSRWTWASYLELFEEARDERIVAEGSAGYICEPWVPEEIYQFTPDAKIIAVLRNPLERAYSHYLFHLQVGYEWVKDFEQALRLEDSRIREGYWHGYFYRTVGLYGQQLRRYFDIFPRENIRVYLSDELKSSPGQIMRDVYRFLGIDNGFAPVSNARTNATLLNRNNSVSWIDHARAVTGPVRPLLKAAKRLPGASRAVTSLHHRMLRFPPFKNSTKRALRDFFADDVKLLSEVLGRDMSGWLDLARLSRERRMR